MDIVGNISGKKLSGALNVASGKDGDSAYDVAVRNGFEGTEAEWLESLKGKKGNSGVYVGSGDMPEDCNVQIDPDGDCITYNNFAKFLYRNSINIDRLTESGVYVVESYSYSLSNGTLCRVNSPAIVHLYQYDDTKILTVWSYHSVMQRCKIGDGEWEKRESNYQYRDEPIYPLTPTTIDNGVATYLLETTRKYTVAIDTDCTFVLPSVELIADMGMYPRSSILVYAYFADAVSVDWGDVLFYNNEVPTISAGYCDIIFTYSPNAQKWTVGILEKGEGA